MPTGRPWLPMCARDTFARKDLWWDSRILLRAHLSLWIRPFSNAQRHVGQENLSLDEGAAGRFECFVEGVTDRLAEFREHSEQAVRRDVLVKAHRLSSRQAKTLDLVGCEAKDGEEVNHA